MKNLKRSHNWKLGALTTATAVVSATSLDAAALYNNHLRRAASAFLLVALIGLVCLLPKTASAQFSPSAELYGNATGSHSIAGGVYTIFNSSGSGIDTNGTSDGFYSLEQTITGDFDLSARIDSATDIPYSSGSDYERVGLVVRSGATPAANEVSAFIGYDSTPSNWGYWITRATVGAANVRSNVTQLSLPSYVRLTRVGDTVTGYLSPDGTTWNSLGTTTRTGDVRIGLAWGSDSAVAGTAVFSGVTLVNGPQPPSPPHAWYRADQGITLDGSGQISNWATQTATGSDLNQIVGSPSTLTLPRSGGGTGTVVDLDGNSALWATVGDWGSLASNRTVVARARVNGSGDGFFFDGSTGGGLTRAQVRGGMWQAGVQSSGFANADPNTTAITAQTWQTHIFQYEESGGNTLVTHWIDGTQVGTHSVSTDTALGGLIIGANGQTNLKLDVELAELIVYKRLLTSTERIDLETDLSTRWGDLTDIPFDYQSGTTIQNSWTVSSSGVQGIAALELTSIGTGPGDTVTSLTFNLNGTTDPADIDELQFYSSASSSFDAGSATLLTTAPAVAGSISINAPIAASKHYLWIAAKLSGNSTNGDFLDAEITGFVLTGPSAGTHVPTVTAPPEFLTVGDTYFDRTLFTSGATYNETVTMVSSPTSMTNYAGNVITLNGGATLTNQTTNTYRIPAIIMAANGDLIATCDARRDHGADLNAAQDIDIAVRRSSDNGVTWSDMEIMCDLGEGHPASDPSLVLDQVTGEIFCFYNYMDRSLPNEYRLWVQSSTDHGQTWSIPRDITDDITLPAWKTDFKFMTSGRGYQTSTGRLLHNIVRVGAGVHLFASDDHGQTWFLLNETPVSPADESKVIELADGRLMINSRVNGGYGARHVHLSSDGGQTWTGYKDTQLVDPGCNGAIIRYTYADEGYTSDRLLFSNANSSSGRVNLTLRISYDEGVTWSAGKVMDPGASAYSDLTICQDGSIGILYEPGYSEVRFKGTTLGYLTDGADSLSKPYQLPSVISIGAPYAWYRADVGVTADGSNNVTNWANQTTSAWDLDQVIGTPSTTTVARSGGGTSTVVRLDGSSSLWTRAQNEGSTEFGILSGDRTVVARTRLHGSGNGFLFDGSAASGKTRAQIRSGMWQAGVQATGSEFTEADPDTGSITAQLWQTHVFQYDESGGNTVVTHWIDGTQVGSHTVSEDTTLSGLILGANGAGSAFLAVDLAEVIVYDRLLNATERTNTEAWLDAQWGDLNFPLAYQSSTVLQTSSTVPKIGIHGVAALELTSIGTVAGNTVTSLTYNFNGTTDSTDVEEVRLYDSGASSTFDPSTAVLLATQSPPVGPSGSFSISRAVTAETQHLWIVVKLRGTSGNGDTIDAEITEFVLVGDDAGTYAPTITAPVEFLTVDANAFYSTVVRKEGDDGSASYRIPGLATSNDGTLLAVFDIRWDNSSDLPGDIDVGLMRSTDGGVTWGAMQAIMDLDENVAGSQGNGVGDPSILVDRVNGRIWCAALHSFGNNGWTGSGPGLNEVDTGQFVLNYSDDDGATWSAPVSITSSIKDPVWNLYFNGPGKGIITRDDTLIFPAQYRDAGGTARSNFIYSTDRGVTWNHGAPAVASGSPWTTESQLVELDNGDLLITMRNHAGNGQRAWATYSWNHATETIADGTWGAIRYDQTDPVVMASIDRYRSTLDGHPFSALLFANPDSGSREKMSIRLSLDEGLTWPYKKKIDDRPAAYSCLTILSGGDIGLFYETGDSSSVATMTFARFPIEWIVGTADADLDGIPDFYEDVMGLNKNDITDGAKDSDGDGVSNFDEYKAQTDPLDKSSSLMANMESNGSGFKLTWPSVPYVNYRVETSTTLEGGSWAVVPGLENVQAQDTSIEVDLPVSAEPRNFYRVLIQ